MLCAGSTLLLIPIVRPTTSQLATPLEVTLFSYWSIKSWFLTEGKLVVLITASFWGFPTASTTGTKIIWRRIWITIKHRLKDVMYDDRTKKSEVQERRK
jgi:hypothetical protein